MKSEAYAKVRALILSGYIKDFNQLATEIQKKTLAKDLGKGFESLMARVYDPGKWTVHEMAKLADLLEVDYNIISQLAYGLRKKKGKK